MARALAARRFAADVPAEVAAQLAKAGLSTKIQTGQSVAITCGSRGIASIDAIVKAMADEVKRVGGEPFVVPAMGSHGGATAEGQKKVLATYGVTEDAVGAPTGTWFSHIRFLDAGDHAGESAHLNSLFLVVPKH